MIDALMDFIMENTVQYFDVYSKTFIFIYTAVVSMLYIYWLKPFVRRKRAAVAAGAIYFVPQIPDMFLDTSGWGWRVVPTLIVAVTVFFAWILDDKRNPVQKAFLGIVFRLISFVTIEIFSELGFYERDIVFSFDVFSSSVTAVVLEFNIWLLIYYGGAILLLYIALKILHRTYKSKRDELTWREFIMLIVPSVTFLSVKPIMRSYMLLWMDGIANGSITENIPGNPYRMLFDVLAYFSILIIIVFYQKLRDSREDEFAREALDKQIADTQRYVKRVESMYEDMRSLKHDMGNHIAVIASLNSSGDTKELTQYLDRWQDNYKETVLKIHTGNAVTDVVISDFADRFSAENIPFDCSYQYPDGAGINPFDVSVVLNNALANALEASHDADKPSVTITSFKRDSVCIVSVRNMENAPATADDDGIPVTTKDGKGHGYGIKNIRSVARKYKGDIEIRQEEAEGGLMFILNVMMIASDNTETSRENM